jgi:hypothetical protein
MRLHAAALRARADVPEHLGDDARQFTAAIERCLHAVEVADEARRSWIRVGRPLIPALE